MRLASLEAVLRALNDADVPFILVGGLAVNAHGYGRLTSDIDLVIRLEAVVIRSAFAALESLGYRPRVPVTADAFADRAQREQWIREKGMRVLNFHSDQHRETPVDVFVSEPFDFGEEHAKAMVEEIAPGVPVHVVSLGTLVRLKREAGRPLDEVDIQMLKLANPEAGDE